MRRAYLLLATILFVAVPASASLESELRGAYGLAEQGDFEQALEALENLEVDYPDQPGIDYTAGTILYRKAQGLAEGGVPDEAAAAYDAASKEFAGLTSHANERVALDASFGRANAMAQSAKMLATPETFKEGVAALRGAEQAYVELLKRAPEHPGAQQNLDHVRFTLKQLLQNAPEQPPEEQDQEQPPPPQQVPVVGLFRGASTQIPQAEATVDGDTVRLQRRGATP